MTPIDKARAMTVEGVQDMEAWLALTPGLHIGGDLVRQAARPFRPNNSQLDSLNGRLRDDGYFQLAHDCGLDWALMTQSVRLLSAAGIPPVFGFLFDEFWAPFHAMDTLYGGLLGPYGMLPDFWLWNVDPAKGEAGWTPHRDRGHLTLRPDGGPISLTTWIPLSPATPLNSCMYIVPAHADPTYGTARENEFRFELPSILRRSPASSWCGTRPCFTGAAERRRTPRSRGSAWRLNSSRPV